MNAVQQQRENRFFFKKITIVMLIICAWPIASRSLAQNSQEKLTTTGLVRGSVIWDGELPTTVTVEVDKDQLSCQVGETFEIFPLNIHPDSGNAIEGAVVYVDDTSQKRMSRDAIAYFRMSHCMPQPQMQAIASGTEVQFENMDDAPHELQVSGPNSLRIVQLDTNLSLERRRFSVPGVYEIKCNRHYWEKSEICCFSQPWFTTTDRDGNYEIRGVPVGTEELEVLIPNPFLERIYRNGILVDLKQHEPIKRRLRIRVPQGKDAVADFKLSSSPE